MGEPKMDIEVKNMDRTLKNNVRGTKLDLKKNKVSFEVPKLIFGKLKNKKGPDWAQYVPIWTETWSK